MAAWEVAAGNVETAAPVSAIGEVGAAAAPALGAPTVAAPAPNILTAAAAPAPGIRPAAPPLLPPTATPAPLPARPVAGGLATPAVGTPSPSGRTGTVIDVIESGLDAFEQGELDKAAELFKQAIQTAPENSEAHAGLGKVLVRQENLTDGIEELKLAVKFDPEDPSPYYVLGFALRAVERNVEAADAYEKFLKLAPDALDAPKMRDWVARIKGLHGGSGIAAASGPGCRCWNYTTEPRLPLRPPRECRRPARIRPKTLTSMTSRSLRKPISATKRR